MAVDEHRIELPPGFRFYPTDEEIITHYLYPKVLNHGAFTATAIGDVDLNKCEPWDLPNKAKMGEKDWYFFCQRDRKYPTGMRTNRATESGYWKATGKDKEIFKGRGVLIGMKKTLVFYKGRAPKGEKTNWVMHEFRLENHMSSSDRLPKSSKDEWAVCKVFFKNTGLKKSPQPADIDSLVRMNSLANDLIMNTPTLPPLMDPLCFNSGVADIDDFEVKAIMGSSAPLNNYYFAAANNAGVRQNPDRNNQLTTPHNSPNSRNPPTPSTSYFHQRNTQSYGSHDHMTSSAPDGAPAAMNVRYLKGEQFSSQSMVSQETETSPPAISKMETGSCASYGRDGGGAIDLTNMWKYC